MVARWEYSLVSANNSQQSGQGLFIAAANI